MKLSKTQAQNSFKYSWLISRIFPYIKPVMGRVILGFLVALPVGLLDGVVAFSLKPYMDYVIGKHDWIFSLFGHEVVIPYALLAAIIPFAVVAFAMTQGFFKYLNSYLTNWTSQKITNSVKKGLFARFVYMDTAFFDENPSGIIISRYLNDPDTASKNLVDKCKNIVTSLVGALGLICVMLYSSWKLALVGVAVLCIAFVPVALIRKVVKRTSNQTMVVNGDMTTNFNETYAGNRVISAYCLQEDRKLGFEKQVHKSFDITMSLVKRSAWMSPLMYSIASVGIAFVLWFGTKLIITGEMTAGGFASFVTSLLLLYKPMKTLGGTLTSIQNVFVALGRVFELFDIEPTIKNKENPVTLEDLHNSIRFNNVSFAYNEEKTVLHNLTLEVPKGETVAIVGNSGGGKSTLVNLIPRFYDVTEGSITIDDVDIRDFSLESLRKNIAMVFQDNFLFTGTIRENILMGNPNATEEELNQAIESAHLEEMLAELPDGLDTELGERGTTLSGGQRQRVAIARAMVRKSPIVILDEATSALDNKSEAVVQKALDNLIQNKTVFVIAHRLSTIKNAHRIAVINEGHLVELGTHDELMKIEGGQYKMLYDMQFKNQGVTV
ncbi:MAG: ABC transporter ATP-binding protein/permease [Cyanobacteria bacterium RUI128]|nr:ABC transporter ATP-binding protein/permease [Cyanobacteria bacterium RUI128]